jgi:spermine oxidase
MLKSSYFICFLFNYFVSGYAERPSVIIVGGGAAGIAAATKLLENSFTNITILEAENRIGGRIHSVKFGDGVVNLGAEYCFGMKGNIVYELAKKYNILEPAVTTLEDNVYYSDGSKLDSLITRDLDALIGEVYLKKYGNNSTIGTSGGDVVIERY